ncbi:MAG: glutamate 5-kinase [Pelagibacteraceae bacterium]|nr:glutamate 5-kinase [Pelagibacteraceae bacterium]|tara:strand:- start:5798 stop:6901 length:1104 start_codon:yes stop_codon:yes gene_type:complete
MIDKYKKIVIKIGSSSIVDPKTKKIRSKWISDFCKDIAKLHKNKKIIIVCSGAIALGSDSISKTKNIRKLEEKQAAAAIGQIELAYQWKQKLKKYKIKVAQLLLTLDDSEIRRRYLNARKTINALHQKNIIPIINENDTVATEEIRYGDNDRLAARVAQMSDSDLLILLSDIDGLYSKNPVKNKNAKKISEVYTINKEIKKMGNYQSSNLGSGGMATKIWAAEICMNNGCTTIITNSTKKNPLINTSIKNSTIFYSNKTTSSSRKQWLLNHLHPSGKIYLDEGASRAIMNNKSLLPAGIIEVSGKFNRGDVVTILSYKQKKIGIGISAYDINEAKKIIGKKTREISKILGYDGRDEIIHKDDLVKTT